LVKKALGPSAESIITQINTIISTIRKRQKIIEEERRQMSLSEKKLKDQDEEIQILNQRKDKEQAQIDQVKGQSSDNKSEIKRRAQLMKNLEND